MGTYLAVVYAKNGGAWHLGCLIYTSFPVLRGSGGGRPIHFACDPNWLAEFCALVKFNCIRKHLGIPLVELEKIYVAQYMGLC